VPGVCIHVVKAKSAFQFTERLCNPIARRADLVTYHHSTLLFAKIEPSVLIKEKSHVL
jgi:hypothetical protein